ncbi:MAG: penicillin-binding protein [Lachnospiraceae bacterium]|nr:penicillin-binding protein [Lachnospiraceae bacterium]
MFLDILEFIWSIIKSRFFIMITIFGCMFGIIVVRAFNLQIVNHEEYVNNYVQKIEKDLTIKSARGLIYDRDGNVLAYNELTHSVLITDTLESSSYKNEQMNEIIYNTIKIIEKNGDSIIDDFPIVLSERGVPEYAETLSENSRLRFLKNMYGTETLDTEGNRKSDTTAFQAFVYLRDEKYNLDTEKYTTEEMRKIIMIRYNLSLNTYRKYISTTIATDISDATMAAIYENEAFLPGVVVSEDTIRRYNDALYFAHIIGYTGKITEDEMEKLNADNEGKYSSEDIVGKLGIEAYFEDVLSGEKGSQKVLVDNLGKVLSVVSRTDATAGNDIHLTIATDLQKAVYHQLEQKIAGILVEKIVNGKMTEEQEEEKCIPVKEAYFQLFNNNVVDIDDFSAENASDNEKNIYEKYLDKYGEIRKKIESDLYNDDAKSLTALGTEWNEYYTYIYRKISYASYGLKVINPDLVDTSDEIYIKWINDKCSLRVFLLHCIDMNWIDISKLNIKGTYSDKDTIYDALTTYIYNTISGDTEFDKLIYKYMINDNDIKANQICMTLYDQGILEYDEAEYKKLKKSNAYAYTFFIEQIRQINITPAQLALEPCSGSVVMTDPNTGDVIAMVSYPSYDNNMFSGSIDYEVWQQLSSDESNPLFNRATKTRIAPGSTFKMITGITALEEKIITANSKIETFGIFENENLTNTPRCWRYPRNHGTITLRKALEVSCNYFFYELGYRLGSKGKNFSHDYGLSRLKKYAEMFGLTEKSGVEIEEYMPLFSTSDIVMSSIGQGSHSYTPAQLARYVSTIANGGYCYNLTLLNKITSPSGELILENNTEEIEPADLEKSTLKTIRQGMKQVIEENYKKIFGTIEYTLAGKTGTAQENLNDPEHALFVAFAPYDEPEVAISTVIPNGYTSQNSAILTRNILNYYFGYITLEDVLNGDAELSQSSDSIGD